MNMSTLQTLLEARHGCAARCHAVYASRGDRSRVSKVSIVYHEGGKVYEYAGTILKVAQRLDLIPRVNHSAVTASALLGLRAVRMFVAPIECADDIRLAYGTDDKGKTVHFDYSEYFTDDYGNHLAVYYLAVSVWH